VTNLPGARVPTRKKGHDFFAVCLCGDVLTILGDIADEEVRVVEHHEVLFASMCLIAQQLFARHIEQLDRHAPGVADAVELRVGIAVGQAHRRCQVLPGSLNTPWRSAFARSGST
jgi:hypothetical protein